MDPTWSEDRGVRDWRDFMAKYAPEGDIRDQNYVFGYNFAMALEHVLKAAGNDLSVENIRRQAYSIKALELPMLLPGIEVNTASNGSVSATSSPRTELPPMPIRPTLTWRWQRSGSRCCTAPKDGTSRVGS
jgi:hypothetical protein